MMAPYDVCGTPCLLQAVIYGDGIGMKSQAILLFVCVTVTVCRLATGLPNRRNEAQMEFLRSFNFQI